MADQSKSPAHDLRALSRALFDLAKRWRAAELLLRLSVFVLGALVILLSFLPKSAPFLVALLTVAAEICLLRSDAIKRAAEGLLRKLDVQESFGWPISGAEVSDILVQSPARLRKKFSVSSIKEQYFASQEASGARRVLENVQESAWWSKHLARRTGHCYLAAIAVLVSVSLVALLVSIETIQNFDILSNIGRVVTSTFMLVFSLGLIRFALDYYRFGAKAAQMEEQIEHLLASGSDDTMQAIKVMHEYQLARAMAPLLPGWLWRLMRDDLNKLWQEYRRRDSSAQGGEG